MLLPSDCHQPEQDGTVDNLYPLPSGDESDSIQGQSANMAATRQEDGIGSNPPPERETAMCAMSAMSDGRTEQIELFPANPYQIGQCVGVASLGLVGEVIGVNGDDCYLNLWDAPGSGTSKHHHSELELLD
ncbi:MAG: hypothetical protein HC924_18595 [Synechococcaceae cyanobacterium SM2_3_2]|nr:hypothetical protein [Synechococcaceae cyanobacterium SM2_3_2]